MRAVPLLYTQTQQQYTKHHTVYMRNGNCRKYVLSQPFKRSTLVLLQPYNTRYFAQIRYFLTAGTT